MSRNINELNLFQPENADKTQASYSSIILHRKCPQAWYYRHYMGLERVQDEPVPYLTLGTWWSAIRAVDSLMRGRKLDSLKYVPNRLSDDREDFDFDPKTVKVSDVIKAARQRWQVMSMEEREAFETGLGASLPDRLYDMYILWRDANTEAFEVELPLGVEMFVRRKLPQPADGLWTVTQQVIQVPPMHLIGFIDEVYYDRQKKMTVIRDHKTSKDINRNTSSLDDLMDSQLMLYAWLAEPSFHRLDIQTPRAIAYDRTRSLAPKEPVLTATGSLSKTVTAYDRRTYERWATTNTRPSDEELRELIAEKKLSAEQARVLYDLPEGRVWGKLGEFYVSGAKAGQPKFGIYEIDDEVLERLSSKTEIEKWTARTLMPVNRKMIDTHLRAAVDTALDIYQTQARVEVAGEAARNIERWGCSMCDFAELCRAQMIGGADGEYDLKSFGLKPRN